MICVNDSRTLTETVRRIQSTEQTAVSVVTQYLKRIHAHNDELGAFIHISKSAIEEARKVDELIGEKISLPLAGAPIAIKDLVDMVAMPATYGALHRYTERNHEDADVVTRLTQAGGIIVGKTNLDEYAFRTTSMNPHFGTARNPWNKERIAGGSSGGSASSVAAGMSAAAIGTDTGGSIRIPAALTGIVGFKPSFGLISRYGVFPLATSLDHVGPMATSVSDIQALMQVMCAFDERDPDSISRLSTSPIPPRDRRVRIGIPVDDFFTIGDPEVLFAVKRAASSIVERRDIACSTTFVTIPLLEKAAKAQEIILSSEALYVHLDKLNAEPGLYGDATRQRLENAKRYLGHEYVWAKNVQREFEGAMRSLFDRVDVLILPTTPMVAPLVGEETVVHNGQSWTVASLLTRYTNLWNLSGLPAITLPCGFTQNGLPIGIQLVARKFEDEGLLQVANQVESALPRPPRPPEYE